MRLFESDPLKRADDDTAHHKKNIKNPYACTENRKKLGMKAARQTPRRPAVIMSSPRQVPSKNKGRFYLGLDGILGGNDLIDDLADCEIMEALIHGHPTCSTFT